MADRLEDLMIDHGISGQWIRMADRLPPKYGEYVVIRRKRTRRYEYDSLLWNGSSFVTKRGCLTQAVEAWFDQDFTGAIPE